MARQQEVDINTRLGRRRISMDKVIYFPRGLAGFEEEHEFTLLQIRPEAPLLVLQSTRNHALGLLVADPYSFLPNYSVTVGDAEQKLLRLKNVRQVAVLVTVSIPPGQPELTALNLTGPILINHKMRIGLQVPQTEGSGPAKFYLQPGPDGNPRTAEDAGQPPPADRE
jgi:flagellar assembly factor FliW